MCLDIKFNRVSQENTLWQSIAASETEMDYSSQQS